MPPRAPYIGLSKNRKPPALLKTVNRQQVNRLPAASVTADSSKRPPAKKSPALNDAKSPEEDVDIYKLPLDSDEEVDEATNGVSGQDLADSSPLRQEDICEGIDASDRPDLSMEIPDSSDGEGSKRADIPPTNFQPGSHRSQRCGSTSTAREKAEDEIGPIRESKERLNKRRTQRGPSPNETSKRSRKNNATGSQETETMHSKLGSHLTDNVGFTVTNKLGKYRGSQSKRSQYSSQSNRSSPQEPFKKPPPEPKHLHTPEEFKFKVPEMNISPSPEFQQPAIAGLPMSSQETYPTSQGPIVVSPSKSESSPCQSLRTNFSIGENDLPNLAIQASPELPLRKKRLSKNVRTDSPSPAFLLPDVLRDILKDADVNFEAINTKFSAETEETESLGFRDSTLPGSPEKVPVTCPMCGECVDAEFLQSFSNGGWMNTRKQARFCEAHKRADAQNNWHARGYPTIDWDKLDARIGKHHRQLKALLNGTSSYYRNVLEANVKAGERTLAQSLRSDRQLLPGYYGSRGLKLMSENIIHKFSPLLRRIAVQDRLVSSRGVAGYVQAVLVPELAILLICEDMDVGVEKARSIMMESAAAGDLVHEEEADVLVRRDDDEDDNWSD